MAKESYGQIAKYTRHFFSGTLLSRISGMIRDISMAALFGDHPSVAAFMVAFRFSHFFRRLLGEGTLQSIFIPHYEALRIEDEKKANGFFFQLYCLLGILLLALIIGVEAFLYFFSTFFGSNEIIGFFSWMFPSLLFICLYGLNLSLLQCKNIFFSSSAAPLACNVVWILGLFAFCKYPTSEAMTYLSLSTVVGFILQWALTLHKTSSTLREGKRSFSLSLFSFPKELRTLVKATLFGLIGVAAVQVNSFLDMIFARYADIKGPVYLWYAIRLQQLPLAVIGFACVYSLTPSLARHIKSQAFDKAQDLFLFGHRRIFLLVIPCTFAIFALGFSSIDLLFGRGHFSQEAVLQTTLCLWAYGIGLLSSTLTLYQSSLFYAYGDSKTPMFISLVCIALNIGLNSIFVFALDLGALSIALSTSLVSWFNYLALQKSFSRKSYWMVEYPNRSIFWKITSTSLIACISSLTFDLVFFAPFFSLRTTSFQLLHFTEQFLIFFITFALSLRFLYKEIYEEMKEWIFPKKTPKADNI